MVLPIIFMPYQILNGQLDAGRYDIFNPLEIDIVNNPEAKIVQLEVESDSLANLLNDLYPGIALTGAASYQRVVTNSILHDIRENLSPENVMIIIDSFTSIAEIQSNETTLIMPMSYISLRKHGNSVKDTWGSVYRNANQCLGTTSYYPIIIGYAGTLQDAYGGADWAFPLVPSAGIITELRVSVRGDRCDGPDLDNSQSLLTMRTLDGSWIDNVWSVSLSSSHITNSYILPSGTYSAKYYYSGEYCYVPIVTSEDNYNVEWVEVEVTYICDVPPAPALSAPSNGATCVTYSSTYFDWGSLSDVVKYEIYISPGGTYVAPYSYYNKNLSQNTTYTWKVRAYGPCGWGAWSSTRTFTTTGSPATPSLSSPSNGATCVAYSQTNFDWGSVSGATQYEIYISPGGTYTTSSSNYSRTLNPGTTYTWKVRAKNSCNVWGNWSSSRTFTTTGTPGTPSLVSPSNGEENVNPNPVSFDWSSVSGTTQYEINISPGGTYTASSSDYSRTLSECTSYSWRVRAKNSCNIWGDWSITWNFTTDCPQQLPTVITSAATNVSTSSATLNGTVNPNGSSTNYYFKYGASTSYGSQTSTQSAGSGTSVVSASTSVSGLSLNTTYHFQLVATNSGGTSDGNDQTFTTGTVAINDQHYMPLSFELKAAYPNPFNPETTISFALPKVTRITLVVYDIWGREVSRLADGFFGAGNYSVKWRGIGENGQEYPSGIYIVRMITPEFVGSEKIVKMK